MVSAQIGEMCAIECVSITHSGGPEHGSVEPRPQTRENREVTHDYRHGSTDPHCMTYNESPTIIYKIWWGPLLSPLFTLKLSTSLIGLFTIPPKFHSKRTEILGKRSGEDKRRQGKRETVLGPPFHPTRVTGRWE